MRIVTSALGALRDQFASWWGVTLPRATAAGVGPRVVVYGPRKGPGMQVIGVLSQQAGEFVFRYDPAYAMARGAEPLPAFPSFHDEYRSAELWPFFAVRIPPAERSDVRAALERRGLRPDQTLEVLGTLAKRSISNPYQLELEAAR
jgi:hypothetical protein